MPSTRFTSTVKLLTGLAGIALLVILIVYLGPRKVMAASSRYHWMTLLLAVLSYLCAYGMRFLKWSILLNLPPGKLFHVYAAQVFIGHFTPVRVGELSHIALVKPVSGQNLPERMASFSLIRGFELGYYALLVFASTLVLGMYTRQLVILLFVILSVLSVLIILLTCFSSMRLLITRTLAHMKEGFTVRNLLYLICFTTVQHLFEFFSAVVLVQGLYRLNVTVVSATYMVASVISILSMVPGGIGVDTLSWTLALNLAGMNAVDAGCAALIHRGITLSVIALAGLWSLYRLRTGKGRPSFLIHDSPPGSGGDGTI